jgi:uncharacterized membrane protein (DUF2068 family)
VKRSIWVTVSLVLQGLWTLTLLGLATDSLVFSVAHPENSRAPRASALVSALLGLLFGIGWYGLWRRKLWGWWLACICSWGFGARFVHVVLDVIIRNGWSVINRGLVVPVCCLILPIWLVTPATRKIYWNPTKASEV